MALTYVVPAPGETTGSILNERGGLEAHVYANDPLGRKMAAAPELVDLVRDAFATDAELAARFQTETGQAPPDEAAEKEQPERRAEFDAWLTRYQLELTRRAKAALKRAGEEP